MLILTIRASTTDFEIDSLIPFLDMRKESKERRDDASVVIEQQGNQSVLDLYEIDGVTVLWSEAFNYAMVNQKTTGIGDSKLFTADDGVLCPLDAMRLWQSFL